MLKLFFVTLALLSISLNAFADPTTVTCQDEKTDNNGLKLRYQYSLTQSRIKEYSADFQVTDAKGKVVQSTSLSSDDDGFPLLRCKFGKDPLIFSCLGGTRMGPWHTNSQRVTVESYSDTWQVLKITVYKSDGKLQGSRSEPTVIEFPINQCEAK